MDEEVRKKFETYQKSKENSNRIVIFTIIAVFLGLAAFFYYLQKKDLVVEEENYEKKAIVQKLKLQKEYLREEKLLEIDSSPVLEYFRRRMLYYHQVAPKRAEDLLVLDLQRDFPGEKGKVLSELLKLYNEYIKYLDQIDKDEKLDRYQKIIEKEKVKKVVWGEELSKLFFPPKDYDTIEKFYAYTERYLKKNADKDSKTKSNHIQKARQEIYGDNYKKLYTYEPFSQQLKLEIKIHEREMSIMDEKEKTVLINDLKQRLREASYQQ